MTEFAYDLLPDGTPVSVDTDAAQRIGSGLTDEDGSPANQQTAHVAKGLSRLIRWFRVGKPRIATLLQAFTIQVQSAEDVIWTYYTLTRDLDNAGGVLLNRLGALVDEGRAQRSDTDYRAVIRTKMALLSSDGKTEQIIAIGRLMVPGATIAITENWPATIQVAFSSLGGLSLPYVKSILTIGKGAGIRLDVGLSGGAIGDTDGNPAGAVIGDVDGDPLGAGTGLV